MGGKSRQFEDALGTQIPAFLHSLFPVILRPCEFCQAYSLRARCISEIISG